MLSSSDRVAAALRREEPDRVPYCEVYVSRSFVTPMMGWDPPAVTKTNFEGNEFTVDEYKAVAERLGLDNLTYVLRAPVYSEIVPGAHDTLFYGRGLIRSEADLAIMRLPNPHDDAMYADAETFTRNKGGYAAWFITRLGVGPTMLSLGIEEFCLALYDDRRLVETVLDAYVDWIEVVAERVCQLGFDAFVTTDDIAFNNGPFFSLEMFREVVRPRLERIAKKITIPWIFHSDGDVSLFLDDFAEVGITAVHPIEPAAMDIRKVKTEFGDRLCLIGNVDMNLLSIGTKEQVEEVVRDLVRDVAPGGGYILSSGNSLAHYCRAENVLAMSAAVRRLGSYPIKAWHQT